MRYKARGGLFRRALALVSAKSRERCGELSSKESSPSLLDRPSLIPVPHPALRLCSLLPLGRLSSLQPELTYAYSTQILRGFTSLHCNRIYSPASSEPVARIRGEPTRRSNSISRSRPFRQAKASTTLTHDHAPMVPPSLTTPPLRRRENNAAAILGWR